MQIGLSGHSFEKYSNTKHQKNLRVGAVFVPCGQADRRRGTMKLEVAFHNSAKALKKTKSILRRPQNKRPFRIP
jgi:hypothetical protein